MCVHAPSPEVGHPVAQNPGLASLEAQWSGSGSLLLSWGLGIGRFGSGV